MPRPLQSSMSAMQSQSSYSAMQSQSSLPPLFLGSPALHPGTSHSVSPIVLEDALLRGRRSPMEDAHSCHVPKPMRRETS